MRRIERVTEDAEPLRRAGRAAIVAVMTLAGALGAGPVVAGDLEPPPAYAASRSLRQDASLRAVAFRDGQTGVAVGDRGTILVTSDGGGQWEMVASGVECRLDAVCWLGPQRVVVVGGSYDSVTGISRGAVLSSDDAGRRWRRGDDADLPRLRRLALRDDRTLVAHGDWSPVALADRFESRNGGKSWHGRGEGAEPSQPVTSQEYRQWTESAGTAAIVRAACRGGRDGLWAVGDHGLIAHSSDGGESWNVQRGHGRQTAVLVVADTPATAPWPLIGHEALEMRHRVSLMLRRVAPGGDSDAEAGLDRLSQAAVRLGAGGADRLRVGDESDEALQRECANWMAAHRPAVVVLDQSLPEVIRSALTEAALEHGAERVVSCAVGGRGQTRLHRNALMTSAGVFAGEFWADALRLVAPAVRPGDSITTRRVYDSVGAAAGGESVAFGMSLSTGRSLAAGAPSASRRRLQVAKARLNMRQRLQPMLSSRGSSESLGETLQAWLDQTPREDRLRLAWSVWQACERAGAAAKQAAVLGVIQQRFSDHSAGHWAAMRREAIEHSREWSRLPSPLAQRTAGDGRAAVAPVPVSPFSIPDGGSGGGGVVPASATSPLLVPERKPVEVATARSEPSGPDEAVDLSWQFHPLVLIAREAARRRGDDATLQAADEVSADLRRLIDAASGGPWQRLLTGPAPLVAPRAEQPPRLDGVADEACWSQRPVELSGSLQLQMAYDDKFVYAAIRAPAGSLAAEPGEPDSPRERPARRRDHDLARARRVQLSLDTDRDLLTAMRMAFTADGRTHDSVDGNPAWQPTWYVAPRADGQYVHWELAIQRRDLVELPLHAGQSWFVSLRRFAGGQSGRPAPMPSPGPWVRVAFQ